MSAEETVFSISDLRLYILQYAIEEREMERNTNCIKKCTEKIDDRVEFCLYNISCCLLYYCCCLTHPNFGFGVIR